MTTPGGLGPPPAGTFVADDPKKPALNAVRCLDALFSHEDRYVLMYYRENFYQWGETHWEVIATDTLTARVYKLFEHAVFAGSVGTGQNRMPAWQDFDINKAKLSEILEAMKHQIIIDRMVAAPSWIYDGLPVAYPELPANEMIACQNLLVHAGSRRGYSHTPNLLNHFSVPYSYDANADVPDTWMRFLHELWPDDIESIETLQEIFGYLLTRRTDLQKMFMLIGPPRSGKGTIIRVLTAMLGNAQNVTSISMADLNQPFGLEEVVDKTLAIMQDARFRSRDDGMAVERILSITGEDPVSVSRKFKALLTIRLPVRFLLVSNELPKMQDESGALRTRMLMLRLRKTVDEARRDNRLTDKLIAELPGILNWSLDGLQRVASRRAFVQPKSAEDDLDLMADLSSPKKAFIDDCCHVGPMLETPKDELFQLWRTWCDKTNTMPGNKVHFSRDLFAAVSDSRPGKMTIDGKRVQTYRGIGISESGQDMLRAFGVVPWPGMNT